MSRRYVYQRDGGSILRWNDVTAPRQAQAAEARSLGDGDYFPTSQRPGAPETIGSFSPSVKVGLLGALAALVIVGGLERSERKRWKRRWSR
jgi:hypothetical protein